jgi:hypothetical protein
VKLGGRGGASGNPDIIVYWSCRVLFGYMSTFRDAQVFVSFIDESSVSRISSGKKKKKNAKRLNKI